MLNSGKFLFFQEVLLIRVSAKKSVTIGSGLAIEAKKRYG